LLRLSEHLRGRPIEVCDQFYYCQLYQAHQIMRHIGPVMDIMQAEKQFKRVLEQCHQAPGRDRVWIVVDRKNRPQGLFSAHRSRKDPSTVVIGIILKQDIQGQGLAQTITSSMCQHLASILLMSRIIAEHGIENHASRKLLSNLGFRPCGTRESSHGVLEQMEWTNPMNQSVLNGATDS